MTRIKTVFITSDASAVAGVGPCLADALEHIDRRTIDALVVCPWESEGALTILPRLERLGAPLYTRNLGKWMPSPTEWGLAHLWKFFSTLKARVWSLANLIEREDVQIVYTNGLPCMDGALAALITRRPHIWHLHEAIQHNPDLKQYLPSFVIQGLVGWLSNTLVVNSNFLAREFGLAGRLTPVKTIHNGVEISLFSNLLESRGTQSIQSELNLSPNTFIVLAVGTINPRKSYDSLINAAALVLSKRQDVCFLVAGSKLEDYSSQLDELVVNLGLEKNFRFLGSRQDIPYLMSACDIFVHSAKQETFGRVLIEAMACGKPIISTRCGGPEEIVVDGETGFLIPIGAADTCSARIMQLLESAELRNQFGHAGKERARSMFSIEQYARSIENTIFQNFDNRH